MATQAPYLDFMSFARGREWANKLNQQDVAFDQKTRADEAALAQSEATFNLKFPLAQLGAQIQGAQGQAQLKSLQGNQEFAQFEADTLRSVAGLDPATRGTRLATEIATFAQRASPEQLGNLARMGQAQALNELKLGNVNGAAQLLRALPGADTSAAVEEMVRWRDPKHYRNPEAIRAGGGEPTADGRVNFFGVLMTPEEFAQYKAEAAIKGALTNTPALLANLAGAQNKQQREQQFAEQTLAPAYAANNMSLVVNPVTGQLMVIPRPAVSASYPETAGVRYPAPTAADAVATPPAGTTIGVGAPAPVRQQMLQLPPAEMARENAQLAQRYPAPGVLLAPPVSAEEAWTQYLMASAPEVPPTPQAGMWSSWRNFLGQPQAGGGRGFVNPPLAAPYVMPPIDTSAGVPQPTWLTVR